MTFDATTLFKCDHSKVIYDELVAAHGPSAWYSYFVAMNEIPRKSGRSQNGNPCIDI